MNPQKRYFTWSHTQKEEASRFMKETSQGYGLEEFFITKNDVIFSELSPRPHDTGMVTMYTQNLSEFDLHVRAILGYPINEVFILREGYSTVIKADGFSDKSFDYKFNGIEKALELDKTELSKKSLQHQKALIQIL